MPPEHLGGAELQAERLAQELAARGHRVRIYCRAQSGRPRREERAGVQIDRRPVVPWPGLRPLAEVWLGARQVRRYRPQVLLCFMTMNSGLIGAIASAWCKIPFVIWQRSAGESLVRVSRIERALALRINRRAGGLWLQARLFVRIVEREYQRLGRSSLIKNASDSIGNLRCISTNVPDQWMRIGHIHIRFLAPLRNAQ